MGSYPYPPNGMVEIDYEYILIFKKPGKSKKIPKEIKELSKLSKEEWKEYYSGHWNFGGAKQIEHQAMFPEELPKRIIKMFSFVGETVLDPFLGSGTTAKVALELNRNVIGYEINEKFLEVIKNKIKDVKNKNIDVLKKSTPIDIKNIDYLPKIKDAKPVVEPDKFKFGKDKYYKVIEVLDDGSLKLDTGLIVNFRGINIIDKNKALFYLKEYVLKRDIFLKFDKNYKIDDKSKLEAYIYLKNKIFINSYLLKSGFAQVKKDLDFDMKEKFLEIEEKYNPLKAGSIN